jgi:hypothetical protein
MIGQICPASMKEPIWISCSRLGATINHMDSTLCALACSVEDGLATETSMPPFFTTAQERSNVSFPTVSRTRSTSWTTSSKRVAVSSMTLLEVVMAGRGGCDDLCASPVSKLDSKDCNASCRSVNEDGLPCDQPRVIKERLLGRQSSNRSADCRHIIERARLGY